MPYSIINDIERHDMMIYIGVIILCGWFMNRIKPSWYSLIGIVVGIIIVLYLYEKSDREDTVFTKKLEHLLNSELYKPYRYLYLNSELVIFIDEHREYYQYNPSAFKSMMQHIDNFLRIGYEIEIGTAHYNEDYSIMRHLKGNILNYYHSIIHKLPHTQNSLDKFHIGMEDLRGHINKYLDTIHYKVNAMNLKSGVNNQTSFVYRSHPKPLDSNGDARWSFFQYEV